MVDVAREGELALDEASAGARGEVVELVDDHGPGLLDPGSLVPVYLLEELRPEQYAGLVAEGEEVEQDHVEAVPFQLGE